MVNGSGVPQPNADKQPCVLCAGFGQRVLRANIWWSRALKAGGFEYSCGGKIHVEGDTADNDKQGDFEKQDFSDNASRVVDASVVHETVCGPCGGNGCIFCRSGKKLPTGLKIEKIE